VTIFQQNLRKKVAVDPDAEFQDTSLDAVDAPSPQVSHTVTPLPTTLKSAAISDSRTTGKGNVRIAGRLEGDINIQGDLSVSAEAQLNGTLRARQVTLAGKLEGNIESAEKVELLDTAILIGDLKTGTLTIAAGSRVRGSINCGWESEESEAHKDEIDADLSMPMPPPELPAA